MTDQGKLITGLVVLFIVLGLVAWILPSWFEARAFNAITGKNVTTWQALWVDLRVMGGQP